MKRTSSTRFYMGFLAVLITIFAIYNLAVYTKTNPKSDLLLSREAIAGENLWQQNNCFSCHQLYGLGGYLGPDLTNVYSTEGKGEAYINAFLNSGIKTMPKFNFTEKEKSNLVAFLKEVDQTGIYPNLNAKIEKSGWVTLEYKSQKAK